MPLVTPLPPLTPRVFLAVDPQELGKLIARAQFARDVANTNEVLDPFTVQTALTEVADILLTLLCSDRCEQPALKGEA